MGLLGRFWRGCNVEGRHLEVGVGSAYSLG